MKKLLSLALALVLVLSMSVTAFAASNAPSVLYIDVAGVTDSEKTISGVYLWVYANSGTEILNKPMTHVSGTIYSCDISSVSDPDNNAHYSVFYTDNTSINRLNTTEFESGKNLFTASDLYEGTWSVYGESTTPTTPAGPTVTNDTQNVTGKYVEGTDGGTIYKVDISWGSMAFTYTAASKGIWSTSNHTYEGAKDAAWSWADGANKITVTNHSNAGINVVPTYTADSNYATVIMNFPGSPFSMGTADNGENGAAGSETSSTITVTPSGDLPKDTNGKIGSITLSIAGTDDSSTGGDVADYTTVSTLDDLTAVLASGGNIKLANDITMTETASIWNTVTLDLNNCTLNVAVNGLLVCSGASLSVKNGTIVNSDGCPIRNDGGVVSVENCTLTGNVNVLYHRSGTSSLPSHLCLPN